MDQITMGDIIKYNILGEGTGTGYFWFRDVETHDYGMLIFINGECTEMYQLSSKEKFDELLERVKNENK